MHRLAAVPSVTDLLTRLGAAPGLYRGRGNGPESGSGPWPLAWVSFELTGQAYVPGDRDLETAHARVERVWRALVEIAPDEPPSRPVLATAALVEMTELANQRRRQCDYAGAGRILPDLLGDLHAACCGPDSRAGLTLLVKALYVATFTLRNLGYVAEATLAAERCRQAAERLDAPVPLAISDWLRAHTAIAAGSFRRSLTLTTRAADALSQHMDELTAPEVLGMLNLTSALAALGDKHPNGTGPDLPDRRLHVRNAYPPGSRWRTTSAKIRHACKLHAWSLSRFGTCRKMSGTLLPHRPRPVDSHCSLTCWSWSRRRRSARGTQRYLTASLEGLMDLGLSPGRPRRNWRSSGRSAARSATQHDRRRRVGSRRRPDRRRAGWRRRTSRTGR